MFFYMTSGTPEFMEKIQQKNEKLNIILLHGQGSSMLLYSSEKKKSIFATPRKFEVLAGRDEFEQRGFFAMENIPMPEDNKPVFEDALVQHSANLATNSACIAYRVLKPIKSEIYIVISQWAGPASYDVWKQSDAYKNGLAHVIENNTSTSQAMFTTKAYTSMFTAPVQQ